MIEEYIADICDILGIEEPAISYNTDTFQTETMRAQYVSAENVIRIRRFEKPDPDIMFAIAHELRHAWQIQYHEEMLAGYKNAGELSTEDYNLQEPELDANAFALILMEDFFNLTPRFYGMSEKVVQGIHARAEEIAEEIESEIS